MIGALALGLAQYFVSMSGWAEFLLIFVPAVLAVEVLFFWWFGPEMLVREPGSDAADMAIPEGASGASYSLRRVARHSFMLGFPAMIFGFLASIGARAVSTISEEQSLLFVGLPGALLYGSIFFCATNLTPAGELKLRWRRQP